MDEEIEEKLMEIITTYEEGGRISPHVFAMKNLWKIHLFRWIRKNEKLCTSRGRNWDFFSGSMSLQSYSQLCWKIPNSILDIDYYLH